MKFERYIDAALPIALEIERKKKHVSMIVRKGVIESFGINQFKTHPLAKKYGYRYDEVHSELDAFLKYKGPRDNLVLINFRFNRYKEMRMSRPCKLCVPWCDAIFDEIYHTTEDGLVKFK